MASDPSATGVVGGQYAPGLYEVSELVLSKFAEMLYAQSQGFRNVGLRRESLAVKTRVSLSSTVGSLA